MLERSSPAATDTTCTKKGSMNPLRILNAVLGFLFFGLAAVGAFIPVLPTVPFLLLAAFFFSRSSQRFDDWFTATKLYQNHLESFLRHRSMTLKTKVYIQTLATVMMLISLFVVPLVPVKVFLVVMMLFMYYYFARHIKTITPEQEQALHAADLAQEKNAAED